MVEMWIVRAGENAFLIEDFKQLNCVAIGWEVGDLSGKTPDEIKEIMKEKYPDASATSLGLNSAQVIKFACDFQIGDYVISYNPATRKYLIGKISSDYYYSDILTKKYNLNDAYCHFRNVEWIGETKRDDLTNTSIKPLKSVMTLFNINNSAKNELLTRMNNDKIEWTDFYMEFAEKLLEYEDNRKELINKIYKIFEDLKMRLPNLGGDVKYGNKIIPFDMDPFTVFALFNKQISTENRINLINQVKKEFSIKAKAPYTFHGIAVVNNLKATFYWSGEGRREDDIDNLWILFKAAVNFNRNTPNEFCSIYDKVINQKGIQWNITMALNWIRPFDFINLDANNKNSLSSDEMFSQDFKNEIKSLKSTPKAKQYLHICDEVRASLRKSNKFNNFPEFSQCRQVGRF